MYRTQLGNGMNLNLDFAPFAAVAAGVMDQRHLGTDTAGRYLAGQWPRADSGKAVDSF
jgi:hypothetical protein